MVEEDNKRRLGRELERERCEVALVQSTDARNVRALGQ